MNLNAVRNLDVKDPLANKRDEFLLPQGHIYLDGNSLGALPKRAAERLHRVTHDQWGHDLITSWNKHHWIDLPVTAGEKIASLTGAAPGQVAVCDSISVNLFKLLAFALTLQPHRHRIVSQIDNFPTDLYIAQGLQDLLGQQQCQLTSVAEEAIEQALDDSVAVLMLTQVNFRSGRLHDMRRITRLAHERGILVLWDLAHSAGALPVQLDDCQVDFAVGCGYKYLNGGPGAPAFVYVAHRHLDKAQQPLTGWMGHAAPFAFEPEYRAGGGILQFLSGTPPILSLSGLDAALDVFADIDLNLVREKSLGLSELFMSLVADHDGLSSLQLISPRNPDERGSQLAYSHPHAYEICQALAHRRTITDFRAPDILRIGFTPLYTRYEDVWHCVMQLAEILTNEEYLLPQFAARQKVT